MQHYEYNTKQYINFVVLKTVSFTTKWSVFPENYEKQNKIKTIIIHETE